jgi:hypothetical protein
VTPAIAPASVSDAELIDRLASRINHLGMSRVDPQRFHVERNEIVVELRRLAKRLRSDRRGEPTTVWRSHGR